MKTATEITGSDMKEARSFDSREGPSQDNSPPQQYKSAEKLDLKKWFGDVKVITLEKFPKRWQAFQERALKAGITGYEKFPAILGDAANPPVWWRAGAGAWGCMMSHLHIVQQYLTKIEITGEKKPLLLFEDDVLFSDDFTTRLPEIMEEIGDDWDQLYLGGQHLHIHRDRPWKCKTDKNVIHPYNINRTHAFAVNHKFLVKYQQHIIHAPDYIGYNWVAHIDHQLGVLHEKGEYNILAAYPWLCGQAAGKSWTSGRDVKEMWWHIQENQITRR